MLKFHSCIRSIQRASGRAIARFVATEKRLFRQNEKLTAVIAELDDEMFALAELRKAAADRCEENHGIMRRIAQIIRG